MIEDYYGHITPVKNAERILQEIPGWEPIADDSGDPPGSVNAGGAGAKPAKPRTKKGGRNCRTGGIASRFDAAAFGTGTFRRAPPLKRNRGALLIDIKSSYLVVLFAINQIPVKLHNALLCFVAARRRAVSNQR